MSRSYDHSFGACLAVAGQLYFMKFRVFWDAAPCSHVPPKRRQLQRDDTALHPRRLNRIRRRENLKSHVALLHVLLLHI
jgi:hypothetical protein